LRRIWTPFLEEEDVPVLDRMTLRPQVAAGQVYSRYDREDDTEEDKWD
jgi:hypothetical protein